MKRKIVSLCLCIALVASTVTQTAFAEDNTTSIVETEDVVTEDAVTEDVAAEDIVTEDIVTEDIVTEDIVTEDIVTEDVVTEDAVTEDVAAEDVVTEDVAAEDVVTEDIVTEDVVTEDIVTEDAVTEDAVTEDAVTEDVVTEDIVIEDPEMDENKRMDFESNESITEEDLTVEVLDEEEGLQLEATAIPIDKANFPDKVLRSKIKEYDSNNDGQLSSTERQEITTLNLITLDDATGIEHLTYLGRLDISHYKGASLNISKNKKLKRLALDAENLTSLDISENTLLEYVRIYADYDAKAVLSDWKATANPKLKTLILGLDLDSAVIDLTLFPNLDLLRLDNNGKKPEKLNLAACKELTELSLYGFNTSSLNLKGNKKLKKLYLNRMEGVTQLDLSNNIDLELISIDNLGLESIALLNHPQLYYLNLSSCDNLKKVDLSGALNLEEAYFDYDDSLKALNVSRLNALNTLSCKDGALTSLKLPTKLRYLDCSENSLTNLDVSKLKNLEVLECEENALATLDISNNTNLRHLDCEENCLSELDLRNNTKLHQLNCVRNNLKELFLFHTAFDFKYVEISANVEWECPSYCREDICEIDEQKAGTIRVVLTEQQLKDYAENRYGNNIPADVKLVNNVLKAPKPTYTIKPDGIYLEWKSIENVDGYRVYRYKSSEWVLMGTVKGEATSFWTDRSVVSGKSYSYKVEAYKYYGTSEYVPTKSSKVTVNYVGVPENLLITNVYGGAKLTWDAIPNASEYTIVRKKGAGEWSVIGTAATNSFVDTSVANNTEYYYYVQCTGLSGQAVEGAHLEYGRYFYSLSAPKLSSVRNTLTGQRVFWQEVKGADRYRVYYKKPGGKWILYVNTANTNCIVTGLEENVKYTFTVKALNLEKETVSGFDATGKSKVYTKPALVETPKLASIFNQKSGVKITWKPVEGAAAYRVYRKVGEASWEQIVNVVGGTFYVDTTAKSGVTYTYTVRCVTADCLDCTGMFDRKGLTILRLSYPTITNLTCVENGVKVKWSAVTGAPKYRVYRKTATGEWKVLKETTSTSFTDTTAKLGKTYYYSVCIISADGSEELTIPDKTGTSVKYELAGFIISTM